MSDPILNLHFGSSLEKFLFKKIIHLFPYLPTLITERHSPSFRQILCDVLIHKDAL